ncbi:MAG: hypothetical protein JWO02_3926 [Solirubrobacterales bacterium]|nr:hypothetical protein [Solirubrobacterales bacterium]
MSCLRSLSALMRIERHALGPRLFVLRRRLHECHVGLALLGGGVVGGAVGFLHPLALALTTLFGGLLVLKDWRDLWPSTRDTAAWRLGMHRPPDAGAARPICERVPLLAGVATATVGAINVLSAATPELPGRVQALLSIAPVQEMALARALALPAGLALCAVAVPLARRRGRALHTSIGLLLGLAVLNLVKGLDVEEAALSVLLAGGLWKARAGFWVQHEQSRRGATLLRAAAVLATVLVAATAALLIAGSAVTPAGGPVMTVTHALAFLTLSASGVHAAAPFGWLPTILGLAGVGATLTVGGVLMAPLRWHGPAGAEDRLQASAVARLHGTDTLSAFKLRRDLARVWSADGRAFAGYRVEAGTMLLSGDPVGPPDAIEDVLTQARHHANRHGLGLGVVGASRAFCEAARPSGLRPLYLGDEALLDCGPMDLSGGANKSLRKAVNRVARHGYTAELRTIGDLDVRTCRTLQRISDDWRGGAPERGFSMAHDQLEDPLLPDARVVLARDEHGTPRGFLHFVPVFGRPAVSLAFMRRDRDTPNGLTDFLVVEAARLLGEAGVTEVSLNFSAFGGWLRAPATATQRLLGRVLVTGDRWFQVQRLLSFNAKFAPRWQPRYLLFDSALSVPRLALAAMWAEGQLPKPSEVFQRRPGAVTA